MRKLFQRGWSTPVTVVVILAVAAAAALVTALLMNINERKQEAAQP